MLRGMAFIGDAVAHSVFPGLAIAFILQGNLLIGGALAGIITGDYCGAFSQNRRLREDSFIGIFFVSAFALGIIIISKAQGYAGSLESFLFGSITGIPNSGYSSDCCDWGAYFESALRVSQRASCACRWIEKRRPQADCLCYGWTYAVCDGCCGCGGVGADYWKCACVGAVGGAGGDRAIVDRQIDCDDALVADSGMLPRCWECTSRGVWIYDRWNNRAGDYRIVRDGLDVFAEAWGSEEPCAACEARVVGGY